MAIVLLAALAMSSCRTVPTPAVDLPTTPIITEVKEGAVEIVTQTVEIEKVIDHIITITDGPAKAELVGLRDQVVVLKSDARRHVKRIVELEDANSAANRMYADEVDKRIKAEALAELRTTQRNIAAIAALILAAMLTVGIIIAIKK